MDIKTKLDKLSRLMFSNPAHQEDAVSIVYLQLLETHKIDYPHTNNYLRDQLRCAARDNRFSEAHADIDDEITFAEAETAVEELAAFNTRGPAGLETIEDERLLKILANPSIPTALRQAIDVIADGGTIADAAEELGCSQRELTWGMKSLAAYATSQSSLFTTSVNTWTPGLRFAQTKTSRKADNYNQQQSLFGGMS